MAGKRKAVVTTAEQRTIARLKRQVADLQFNLDELQCDHDIAVDFVELVFAAEGDMVRLVELEARWRKLDIGKDGNEKNI